MLWMFHPNTHGKGFGFDRNIFIIEQIVNISCRMPCGQNDLVDVHRFAILKYKRLDSIIFYNKVGDLGVKVDFSTMICDGFSNILNDFREFVGANMWMGIYQNLIGSTMENEILKNPTDITSF